MRVRSVPLLLRMSRNCRAHQTVYLVRTLAPQWIWALDLAPGGLILNRGASILNSAGGSGGKSRDRASRYPFTNLCQKYSDQGVPHRGHPSGWRRWGWLFFFSGLPIIIHLGVNTREIAERVVVASLKGAIDALDQIGVLGLTSRSEGC